MDEATHLSAGVFRGENLVWLQSVCGGRHLRARMTKRIGDVTCPECLEIANKKRDKYIQTAINAVSKAKNATRTRDFPIVDSSGSSNNMMGIKLAPPSAGDIKAPPVLLLYHPLVGLHIASPFGVHPHIIPYVNFDRTFIKIRQDDDELLCYNLPGHAMKSICIASRFFAYIKNALDTGQFDDVLAVLSIALSGDHYRLRAAFQMCLKLMQYSHYALNQRDREHIHNPPKFDLLGVDGICLLRS